MSVGRSQSLRGKGYDRTSFIFDSPPPKDSETSSLESMESLKSFLEVSENPNFQIPREKLQFDEGKSKPVKLKKSTSENDFNPFSLIRSRSLGHSDKKLNEEALEVFKAEAEHKKSKSKSKFKHWYDDAPNTAELKKLSMKEIRFQSAIYEIYTTERDYVEDLDLLIEIFYAPLSLKGTILNKEDVETIFRPIKDIIHINKKLLKDFKDAREKNTVVEGFGNFFIKLAEQFKIYSVYCCNYDRAVELLQKKLEKEKFATFVKMAETDDRMKKVPLVGYLIKPVQRATRYPLLIKEALKYCDESHPDFQNITEAYSKMKEVADQIDKDRGFTAKIQEIISSISTKNDEQKKSLYKLIDPKRKFIQEFTLPTDPQNTIQLYLFNDRSLLALNRIKKKPRFLCIFINSTTTVYPSPDESIPENFFLISNEETDQTLGFDGEAQKDQIIEILCENGYKKDSHSHVAPDLGSPRRSTMLSLKTSFKKERRPTPEAPGEALTPSYDLLKSTSEKMTQKSGLHVREHEFVLYTYATAAWCDHCGNFIWGFKNQAYKCKYCYLDCHKKCLESVTLPCKDQSAENGKETGIDSEKKKEKEPERSMTLLRMKDTVRRKSYLPKQ